MPDGSFTRLVESKYESEDRLQALIADTQGSILSDQFDPVLPPRMLLIAREMGIPDSVTSGIRWSVDHFFVDRDGIPTLIEVKRSSDSRIRREVVGQMLDYVSNAVDYWAEGIIEQTYFDYCARHGIDAVQRLHDFLGDPDGAPDFWATVETNLRASRVRLMFVADVLPRELRKNIEFLNAQMTDVEVQGIELRQYVGNQHALFIPEAIGKTTIETDTPEAVSRDTKQWDERSFFAEVEQRNGAADTEVARQLLAWGQTRGLRIWWGKGPRSGSFFPMWDHAGDQFWTFAVWTYGRIEFQFQHIHNREPFDNEALLLAYRDKLNEIDGIDIPEDGVRRRPSIDLAILQDENRLLKFLAVHDWYLEELRTFWAENQR